MGVWCIPPGDPLNARFQTVKAAVLHKCCKLCSKTSGQCGFVNNHATPGFRHRGNDGFNIEGDQRAEVDHFRIDPGFIYRGHRDMDHRPVCEHGCIAA